MREGAIHHQFPGCISRSNASYDCIANRSRQNASRWHIFCITRNSTSATHHLDTQSETTIAPSAYPFSCVANRRLFRFQVSFGSSGDTTIDNHKKISIRMWAPRFQHIIRIACNLGQHFDRRSWSRTVLQRKLIHRFLGWNSISLPLLQKGQVPFREQRQNSMLKAISILVSVGATESGIVKLPNWNPLNYSVAPLTAAFRQLSATCPMTMTPL